MDTRHLCDAVGWETCWFIHIIVANGRDLRYFPGGSTTVLIVPHNKLVHLDLSVDELLGLCYSDIKNISICLFGLSRELDLARGGTGVAPCTGLVVLAFGSTG